MKQSIARFALITMWMVIGLSCRNSDHASPNPRTSPENPTVSAIYHGILPSPEYDSIVNDLIMYPNETFDLRQVDRIAEHHLNEKNHKGIYAYLADSTRLGLYSEDGYLMLQFLLTDAGMTPMIVHTDQVIADSIVWKRLRSTD